MQLGYQYTEIITGPPGVGKTTEALRIIQEALSNGTEPDSIGLISFTRAAVNEARTRFGLSKDEGKWFRTLHSICYELTGANQADLILPETIYNMRDIFGEEVDYYYLIYSLHRVTGRRIEDIWTEITEQSPVPYDGLMRFYNWYVKYKGANSQQDFYDLLDGYTQSPLSPMLDVLIIDEAQDLNLQQWRALQAFATHSKNVYIIGDPDQAIYEWAGASVGMELVEANHRRVLDQSYRIPIKVHHIAENILSKRGKVIQYKPTQHEGSVTILPRPDDVYSLDLSKGKWLFLCRTRYTIQRFLEHHYAHGLYIPERTQGAAGKFGKFLEVHDTYKSITEGITPSRSRMLTLSGFCQGEDPTKLARKGAPWQKAFNSLSPNDIQLYTELLKNSTGDKRIEWATFHGSKGSECENVVVLGGCNRLTIEGMERDPDPELRLLYVAVTRTRQNLYLVPGVGRYHYDWRKLLW